MPRFTFVDISADDPQRAIKFYKDVFGWKIEKWEGPMDYWLIKTGDPGEAGVDAGLGRRENPSQFMTPVIGVPSVDDFAARVTACGGTIIQPKMTIPGAGYLISCKDTEGNTFSIMQSDESVK
jgi:predicted enzyme related to lactoylglutathione lyase